MEDELAGIRAEYKSKIKPLDERIGKVRDELKAGGDYVKGDCFKFVDEDEGMVGFYTPEGYLLEQRAIRTDRTGTND